MPSPINEAPILFFDCETGGLNPFTDEMLEIACIKTDPTGDSILQEYHTKIKPKNPERITEKAAAINGYTLDGWSDSIDLDKAMIEILSMASSCIFAAHNAPFDWSFLDYAMKKRGQRWPGRWYQIDTVSMSWPLLVSGKVPDLKLITLAKYFNIDHDPHRAASDTHACRQIYMALMKLWNSKNI